MRRRKHSAQLDPMLVGLLAESAEWLKRYDLRAQHDLLHGEYSRLHQRAIAIRWSDPLEHDHLMAAAREIREQRDNCMRQLIDLPAEPSREYYAGQTILPARAPSARSRIATWLRH